MPAVGYGIGGNAVKPGDEWNAAPFEAREIFQGVLENLGGNVLDVRAGMNASRHERVDALEIPFVEVGEAGGVLLRRFD